MQNLSLVEVRLIQLAIIDARETGLGLSAEKPLTIGAERYAKAFNVNKKNAYEMLKEAEDTLFNRRFSFIDSDGKMVKSRWVQQVKYFDGEGKIEIAFTTAVVKGISRIGGAVDFFTQYLLSNTVKFKSVYSVRLYELLVQWKNSDLRKMPMFEVDKLRGQLGIDTNQYQMIADFKKRVLDKAISEINEHSDLVVSYEQVKEGRVISGFRFKIRVKQVEKDQDKPIKMTNKQRAFFAVRLAHHPELQELAQVGKSMEEYIGDIFEQLETPKGQEFYKKYLFEVGFK